MSWSKMEMERKEAERLRKLGQTAMERAAMISAKTAAGNLHRLKTDWEFFKALNELFDTQDTRDWFADACEDLGVAADGSDIVESAEERAGAYGDYLRDVRLEQEDAQ